MKRSKLNVAPSFSGGYNEKSVADVHVLVYTQAWIEATSKTLEIFSIFLSKNFDLYRLFVLIVTPGFIKIIWKFQMKSVSFEILNIFITLFVLNFLIFSIQKVSNILDKAHLKSKPISIGAHHTVSGHEALDLAKRLNEELASQQQTKQTGSLETPRPISPNAEPRSRSYEQHAQKSKGNILIPIDFFWLYFTLFSFF